MPLAVEIPYGAYRSTPFCRWQGSFASLHSIEFAAEVTRREMAKRAIDAAQLDRTSNGPHVYYPSPSATGGTGESENWVLDNFGCDPLGGHSMLVTAENVARKHDISTAEQHEVVLLREAQYRPSLPAKPDVRSGR